ncbi:MAG TPA: hypothetical protein VHV77_10935, partial [Pirellulales bacterium]|nr:hypothetical protein [Pirellulales bacterium]
ACMMLKQEGIEAFVADANVVTTDWFFGNAIGYVKLQVPSSQAAAAAEVLRNNATLLDAKPPEPSADDAEAFCLSCGAPMADDAEECAACGWSYEGEGACAEEDDDYDEDET